MKNKKLDIETIRKAILKHRGGFQQATNDQIMRLWNALPEDVQQQYLLAVRPENPKTQPPAAGEE